MIVARRSRITRVLHSLVLVRLDRRVTKSATGVLHLPDTGTRQPERGTVMACGPGRWVVRGGCDVFIAQELHQGDVVYLGRYNGWRVDETLDFNDGHEWWLCETMPGITMSNHPGDIYAYVREEL